MGSNRFPAREYGVVCRFTCSPAAVFKRRVDDKITRFELGLPQIIRNAQRVGTGPSVRDVFFTGLLDNGTCIQDKDAAEKRQQNWFHNRQPIHF
jgi:hypothetical protein